MDALTLYQPWASLVVLGFKPLEFRHWDFSVPKKIGPRIVSGQAWRVGRRHVIHASARKIKPAEVLDLIQRIEGNERSTVSAGALPLLKKLMDAHKCQGVLELGAGLGTAELGKPHRVDGLFQTPDSDRITKHLYAWPMKEPKPFNVPVPMKGLQGFWTWTAPVPPEAL